MSETATLPSSGQIVRVRQRLYLVEQTVPRSTADSTLVRMSCVDTTQGSRWRSLGTGNRPEDRHRRGVGRHRPARVRRPQAVLCLPEPPYVGIAVTATDPKLFQSPFRAGIRLDAYQLEPCVKPCFCRGLNLFIRRRRGSGKTIEALLIARELLLRKKVDPDRARQSHMRSAM